LKSLPTFLTTILSLVFFTCFIPPYGSFAESKSSEPFDAAVEQWKNFQRVMNDHGILFETINVVDIASNVSGGIRQKTAVPGILDFLLTIDTKKIISNWKGTLFLYGLGTYGNNPSRYVGDIQGVSSIEAPNTWKLFEGWYQQNLFERFSLLAGLYDLTSEFDVIVSSSELFMNSSFGTGAEFAGSAQSSLSTFPTTSLVIRGQAIMNDSLMVRAVVADGRPGNPDNPGGSQILLKGDDGLFGAMELAYYQFDLTEIPLTERAILKERPRRLVFRRVGRSAPLEYEAKVALGFWGYSTSLDHVSKTDSSGRPRERNGTYGMYGFVEYDVYHNKNRTTDEELTVFARAGMADPTVNQISQFYSGGMVYRGLFGRIFDQTGIGVAAALNGKQFRRARRETGQPVEKAEITLEAAHSLVISPNLIIQPDVQYVINPGTVPGRKNALLLSVRLEVNFNWFAFPRI
jgi:porin